MRIVLVGPQAGRDRLRRQLLDAGLDIVAETETRPSPADGVPAADAIVEATSNGHASVLRDGALSEDVLTEALTAREQEVMQLVISGLLNKQIAGELTITEDTVKFHRGHVMRKMCADSLADLVRMAENLGVRSNK